LCCIAVESPMAEGPGAGYFVPPAGEPKYIEETTCDNVIEGNYIDGGTHGIMIWAACRNRIVNNTITHSIARNINICPASRHNVVLGNSLLESGSSAVAMAYGSNFNLVAHNKVISHSTSVGVDRDAIHSYVACRHNMIVGNTITGDFRYGVYLAVSPAQTVVQGNIIQLSIKPDVPDDFTVGVAMENDWPERPLPDGALYSRRNFGSASSGMWGYADATGSIIQGNLVDSCTCGFYVAQIGARLAVRGNRWDNNSAMGCDRAFYAFGGAEDRFGGNILSGLITEGCREGILLPPWAVSPFAVVP
jgi:parallel beta-helix repeat protein